MNRYLCFVTKPYSFAILEPLQNYIQTQSLGEVKWFTSSKAQLYPAPGEILEDTKQVQDYQPTAILVPGNVVPPWWPGLKVQVFHGLDDEVKGFYRINGLFDLYCTPGPAMSQRFTSLAERHGHFMVRETGWPKLDPLTNPQNMHMMRRELGLDPERPVILYAPTFPEKYTSAPDLRDPIRDLISAGEYTWLIKFHPLMDSEIVASYRELCSDFCEVVEDLNILPCLQAADILITDTSSVAYEFMLLDRPIITYRTTARLDKGIDIQSPSQLADAIQQSLAHPNELSPARQSYLAEIHPYNDGESSRRVLAAIEEVLKQNLVRHLRRKPLNLIRRVKIRRMLKP
ncbi:CDP-glycerol glycerophosphotransferase family protein [Candidatus Neomarinimicrobiota bacterium]